MVLGWERYAIYISTFCFFAPVENNSHSWMSDSVICWFCLTEVTSLIDAKSCSIKGSFFFWLLANATLIMGYYHPLSQISNAPGASACIPTTAATGLPTTFLFWAQGHLPMCLTAGRLCAQSGPSLGDQKKKGSLPDLHLTPSPPLSS